MTKGLNTTTPSGVSTEIPDYLKGLGGIGNENVTRKDLTVPRLGLLQALSPQLKRNDPAYIPGSEAGLIFHQLTGELFPEGIYAVNCYFQGEVAVFKKRTAGGGFRGTFPTLKAAQEFIATCPDADDLEAIEQHVHYLILLDQDKNYAGEAALVMSSTKMKASRKWNSLIALGGEQPRFSKVWKLTSVEEKNNKGAYYNFAISPAGFIPAEIVPMANAMYNAIRVGDKSVDRQDREAGETDPSDY